MQLDAVLNFLVDRATNDSRIRGLWLFGSRARGTHDERSDYDVAVDTMGMDHASWSQWSVEVRDTAPTLCGLDLVWLPELENEAIKEAISHEGIKFYDHKAG